MTTVTLTDKEFALWIAQRDARAKVQIAQKQGIRLQDYQPKKSRIHIPV